MYVLQQFQTDQPEISVSDPGGFMRPYSAFGSETPTCDSLIRGYPDHVCGHGDGWSTDYFKIEPGASLEMDWPDAGWRWMDEDNDVCPFESEAGCYAGAAAGCRRWAHGQTGERTFRVMTHRDPECSDCDCEATDGVCKVKVGSFDGFGASRQSSLVVDLPEATGVVEFPIGGNLYP